MKMWPRCRRWSPMISQIWEWIQAISGASANRICVICAVSRYYINWTRLVFTCTLPVIFLIILNYKIFRGIRFILPSPLIVRLWRSASGYPTWDPEPRWRRRSTWLRFSSASSLSFSSATSPASSSTATSFSPVRRSSGNTMLIALPHISAIGCWDKTDNTEIIWLDN